MAQKIWMKKLVYDIESGKIIAEDEPEYDEFTRLFLESEKWLNWQRGAVSA